MGRAEIKSYITRESDGRHLVVDTNTLECSNIKLFILPTFYQSQLENYTTLVLG